MNEPSSGNDGKTSDKETRHYQITFLGRADHAGTTSMDQRLDAVQGASAFIINANRLVTRDFPDCLINIGSIQVQPGMLSVIPKETIITLGIYADDPERLISLRNILLNEAEQVAAAIGLSLKIEAQ